MQLSKAIFTNSSGILFSRITGFVRDLLTASVLGANIYSDIFFVAFKLPNLFRRIFAEGAFMQTFLPFFTKTNKKASFATAILAVLTLFILLLTLFVNLFDLQVTKALAYGFDSATITIAAPFVALNFWYLLLIFWTTFLATLLQYKHHFATTAFATSLLNIALIGSLLLSNGKEPETIVLYMSYGVVVGGFFQLFIHLVVAARFKLLRLLSLGIGRVKDAKTKEFYQNFFPSILGNSTPQIAAFLDTWLASFLISGSISYLYYANRIFQLPLALFAIAVSTAIFPPIAKAIKNSDPNRAQALMRKGFWIVFILLSLFCVGGIILSHEIMWLLFERGAFSAEDTKASALILQAYLVGLLPFGLAKIFSLWLYANYEQKKAAKLAIYSLVANVFFALILIKPLGAFGLALAGSLGGMVLCGALIWAFGIRRFLDIIWDRKLGYLIVVLGVEVVILFAIKIFMVI
jgi:putative peptidoglycan lipid II flippase